MTAKDFRLLAFCIWTAPEGLTKRQLAEHFAERLKGTNEAFDADRFVAASMGDVLSRRDAYKPARVP